MPPSWSPPNWTLVYMAERALRAAVCAIRRPRGALDAQGYLVVPRSSLLLSRRLYERYDKAREVLYMYHERKGY